MRRIRRLLTNYLSTLAFIGLAYWIVTSLSAFHRGYLQAEWHLITIGFDHGITVRQVFFALLVLYAVLLLPYYAAHPWMRSASFTFGHGLWLATRRARTGRSRLPVSSLALPVGWRLSPHARQAGLALLLKFFFAPLMINWCLMHVANLAMTGPQLLDSVREGLTGRALFDTALFWTSFQFILFIDTLLFTLGYIVEVPALGNRIRSVDPTFSGWFFCLMCYPPFIDFTTRFLEWQSADFPSFANDAVHVGVNVVVLVALAIFSWASLALGFKASNLTNRGIVSHGPYAFVRHPAYAAKNLAWWLGALPMLGLTLGMGDWRGFAYCLFAVAGWTAIYVLRALTEERHLLMRNNGYAEYSRRVRWRFVPGVW
jgi:protein-S-isoprenylcysteine O-methyltransferase Ste14